MSDAGKWVGRAVVLAAAVVAGVGARPFAGSWNDASRLAAADSLGERGTFVIEDSIFVRVPADRSPYPADRPDLQRFGTQDKLLIDGHYYSDKSPVPNVWMAGLYRVWLGLGGPTARERPDLFCWFLTVSTSGLAYVVAVGCMVRLARVVGLRGVPGILLPAALAFGTVAAAYTRHVNSHILFLGAASVLVLGLAQAGRGGWGGALMVGTAAGLGYTCDLGIGPALLVCLAPFVIWLYRRWWPCLLVALGALPWLVAHHALNYAIGGTLLPANMVPEYLQWPGSPFTAEVMTGGWKHSPGWFVAYTLDLVFGKKGFLLLNLPLWLAPGGAVLLLRFRRELRAVVIFTLGWAGLSLVVYSATSTNYAGQCCSIRWFVPLLAPGFWVVAWTLREFPRYRADFAWLSLCGFGLGALMWWDGPWAAKMPPGLWGWVGGGAVGWGVIRWNDWGRRGRGTRLSASAPAAASNPVTTRSSSVA